MEVLSDVNTMNTKSFMLLPLTRHSFFRCTPLAIEGPALQSQQITIIP